MVQATERDYAPQVKSGMKRAKVASVGKLEKGMCAAMPPKSSRFELNEDPRRNGCSDAQRHARIKEVKEEAEKPRNIARSWLSIRRWCRRR